MRIGLISGVWLPLETKGAAQLHPTVLKKFSQREGLGTGARKRKNNAGKVKNHNSLLQSQVSTGSGGRGFLPELGVMLAIRGQKMGQVSAEAQRPGGTGDH